MIVLDTNVLSELMRAAPDAAVVAWLDRASEQAFAVTAVTVAELLTGIALLADGRRKAGLYAAATGMLDAEFTGAVLPFDAEAAGCHAEIVAMHTRAGRPISMADAQIAAICLRHGAVLATRNGKDFGGIGLTVVNPWHD